MSDVNAADDIRFAAMPAIVTGDASNIYARADVNPSGGWLLRFNTKTPIHTEECEITDRYPDASLSASWFKPELKMARVYHCSYTGKPGINDLYVTGSEPVYAWIK